MQVSKLIEDQDVEPGQAFGDLAGLSSGLFLLEGVSQFDGREEAELPAMVFDGPDAEGNVKSGNRSVRLTTTSNGERTRCLSPS